MLEAFGALGLTSSNPFIGRRPESWLEVLQASMVFSGPDVSPALMNAADEINYALHWWVHCFLFHPSIVLNIKVRLGLIPDNISEAPPFPGPLETPLDYLEKLLTLKL